MGAWNVPPMSMANDYTSDYLGVGPLGVCLGRVQALDLGGCVEVGLEPCTFYTLSM